MNYLLVKTFLDYVISLILLIILSPILLITILLLFLFNNGKIFFFQDRPGLNCKIFTIIKFKTMKDIYNSDGVLLADSERISKIGRIIRSLSIDELLQFVNVLKGEMSIVGPRPLLPKYLKRYNEYQIKRHNVKPGITGLAQVMGRNSLNWDSKFNYDIQYVETLSFFLDIKILFLTIINVLKRDGINSENNEIMPEFLGNQID